MANLTQTGPAICTTKVVAVMTFGSQWMPNASITVSFTGNRIPLKQVPVFTRTLKQPQGDLKAL